MFGTNFFQETPEDFDSSLFQAQLPGFFVPPFDGFSNDLIPKDYFSGIPFPDASNPDQTQFFHMLDQAFQSIPDELKQWFPYGMEGMMPSLPDNPGAFEPMLLKSSATVNPNLKIGSITLEERRIKVLKFLEKRKRRNFKKKISYMCRKKVADKRVRIKGRFVSKVQAEAIKSEQTDVSAE